jgi:O-antigen/teichoic acid export membrane protein
MDVLLLPVMSFIEWILPDLFQHGRLGVGASLKRFRYRWAMLLAFAILTSMLAYFCAPLLPIMFGVQYLKSVAMARWLALLPLTTSCWMVVRSTASTAGHEKLVGMVELIGASFSVTAGILLVIYLNWQGAVLATYVTHVFMTSLVLGYWWMSGRRQRLMTDDSK